MPDAPFGFAPASAGADPIDYSQFIRPGAIPWGSWTVQQAPTPGEFAQQQAGKAWSDVKRAVLPSFMQEPSDAERQAARAAQNRQLAQKGYAPFLPWEHGGNPLTGAVELGAMLPFGAMGVGAKAAIAGAGKFLPAMAGMLPKSAIYPAVEAARMKSLGFTPETLARAKEGGFYTEMPLYHGSGQTFDAFRAVPTNAGDMATPGVSLARNPEIANEFAGNAQANPQVYRVVHRAQRPAVLDLRGDEAHHEVVATLQNAFDNGHDAVMLRNYTTPGGKEGEKIVIVRDPSQLRSPYAEFDPAKRNSANLMAGIAGAAAVPAAGVAITSEQRR